MPRYEYRCRTCATTFEESRTMSQADAPARCPHGHDAAVKLLSTVALAGSPPEPDGGGCCGGGCCAN